MRCCLFWQRCTVNSLYGSKRKREKVGPPFSEYATMREHYYQRWFKTNELFAGSQHASTNKFFLPASRISISGPLCVVSTDQKLKVEQKYTSVFVQSLSDELLF